MRAFGIIASVGIAMVLLNGCGNTFGSGKDSTDVSQIINDDSIPNPVKDVVQSIANRDSVTFASLVAYPLLRPYPLEDIRNSREMEGYFNTLVDDSIYNVVVNSRPGQWAEYGWRGWSLDQGQYLWIDGKIYAVDYVSKREKVLRDSLIKDELASLPDGLSKGWMPVMCLQSVKTKAIYRIDKSTSPSVALDKSLRLCSYNPGTDLHGMPSSVCYGFQEVDGSAGYISYLFTASAGMTIYYYPDISEQDTPSLQFTDPAGHTHSVKVSPAYWLELLHAQAKESGE